ncbi:UTP--glucose-1-phosphate uridylyltransferase GalU [Peribacillus castrilensis]|uniref:UTP--glucose-1-phosphate uridylyltransferase n=1 Tax=Peribacillus simplex TaxID=1478 RepID=A0AAN2TRD8_9BACI|nr:MULTISPECIES: UTP--glucose-1-phosphate uridylyltransferase GalU [Bacillaceae]MCP1093874.1 UTP--glucose-1-phosphate uridylyltransferase GalU [Bacillaceae bacterium OS4b]MBD8586856.1 UTP--glucose-1-phosphate uridylyltransferase GalU [Peribacillus simplex]MCF7621042.1 UTP--glucose-1-phosphate uridylyltransferase GalU [Peribacillus frigoritolerans]MCP1151693.1 UTP--glucose-1-phosphate uridylyltransferase GalU [Peribacillus frigoritolerans]MCT1386895.1 UTP--glucose-1-phosphate uridylyltransferas
MIRKAVIPAAGLGTRFLPATKAQPKEMLPIVDKPTIQYIIEEAVQSGITDIIIVTGKNKRAIEDHFDKSIELEMLLQMKGQNDLLKIVENISNMVDIHYVRQKEPLGLGHAVLCAKTFIGDEPFAVLLGDDIVDSQVPALKQLMERYNKVRASIIGCKEVSPADVSKYGIVNFQERYEDLFLVRNLVEKPKVEDAPSTQAIIGRYILSPAIFEILENVKPDRKGEIQLTEALDLLLEKEALYSYIIEGNRYDVGDKFGFLQASIDFAMKRPELRDQLIKYIRQLFP